MVGRCSGMASWSAFHIVKYDVICTLSQDRLILLSYVCVQNMCIFIVFLHVHVHYRCCREGHMSASWKPYTHIRKGITHQVILEWRVQGLGRLGKLGKDTTIYG